MTKKQFEIELRQVTGKLNLESLWEVTCPEISLQEIYLKQEEMKQI